MSPIRPIGPASGAGHPAEDQMVHDLLAPHGERDPSIAAHLASCDACRAGRAELQDLLRLVAEAPLPDRDERYGAQVWRRLRPRLAEDRTGGRRTGRADWADWADLFSSRRWALAATVAAMVLIAFLAGRHWPVPDAPIPAEARERILLVAVGEHLDRAQRVLVDLANSGQAGPTGARADLSGALPADPSGDFADAQQRAEDLVAANRIYRQAAAGAGDRSMTALLDELERLLLDVAHRPAPLTAQDLEQIRGEIRSKGILFRMRVIGSQVRERMKAASPSPNGPARGST